MRGRCKRRINFKFKYLFFKPRGIQLRDLEVITIYSNDLEILRLRYIKKLSQKDSAEKMRFSQSQYQRDMVKVLEKITDALINGKAIEVKQDQG